VLACVPPRLRLDDLFNVGERVTIEHATDDRRRRSAVRTGLRIAQVDEAVVCEVGVNGHIEQTALPACVHFRHTRDRLRIENAVANDAQPPGPLGNQDVAIRQKRHPPRVLQTFDDIDRAEHWRQPPRHVLMQIRSVHRRASCAVVRLIPEVRALAAGSCKCAGRTPLDE
jgi:hypothetical protein